MDINLNKINKIKNLPVHFQGLIVALPSVILVLLFIFLIFMPKNNEAEILNSKIIKLNKEIVNSEAKIKRLDALIVENTSLKRKLATLKEQLPEEKEVSGLLKQISELGLKSGLEILLWKPQARKTDPQGLYVEIPVNVEVLTEYHELGVFYSHISRLPRLVNISDIKMKVDKMADGRVNAVFTARTFASVKPEDIAQQQGAK